jgi:hypothetical protein
VREPRTYGGTVNYRFGRIADGVDDPLTDMRRDANALWEKKLASFSR